MIFVIHLLVSLLVGSSWGQSLPSSLSLTQSVDADENRFSTVDLSFALPRNFMVSGGASYSHLQFDEVTSGNNQAYFVGLQTDPLADWVFGVDYIFTQVSQQMQIFNPSVSARRFFNDWNVKLEVGYRMIHTDTTPGLAFFLQTSPEPFADENLWWRLAPQVDLTRNLSLGLSYQQFQYSRRFQFLNSAAAQPLGYTLDTINYGGSFADWIGALNLTWYLRRLDFSLDLTHIDNEFDDSRFTILTPSVGYQWNRSLYFNLSLGLTRGITENEESTRGRFVSLGTTISF